VVVGVRFDLFVGDFGCVFLGWVVVGGGGSLF